MAWLVKASDVSFLFYTQCSCNLLESAGGLKRYFSCTVHLNWHLVSEIVSHVARFALIFAILQVLAFFARLGLPLRERPPMMLVDGPTLSAQREKEDPQGVTGIGIEVPVFHTRGLCMSKVWGSLTHVAGTQRGYSQLHKQPSLDATLRPADRTARKVEVRSCAQPSRTSPR